MAKRPATRQEFQIEVTSCPASTRKATKPYATAKANPFTTSTISYFPNASTHLHSCGRFRADGTIWILSGRGVRELPPGVLAVFDIFDRAGKFTKQVAFHGPGDPIKDGIFFAGQNHLVVVKGYMESLAAQFGSGTVSTNGDEEEGSKLAVVYYELEK